MNDLTNFRENIDKIDDEIINCFVKRMEICEKIAIEKAKTCKNIADLNRENEIIERLSKKVSDDLKPFVEKLYKEIFSISKEYQSNIIKKDN